MTRALPSSLLERVLAFFGGLTIMLVEALGWMLRGRISYRHTLRQMADVGVGSLLVSLITVGFSGAVAALYAATQFVRFGQPGFVGGVVGQSLAIEVAPVITAIVVAARSGSAMAAELGSMVVTEQVDALRALATSPNQYLVVPRVLGTFIMLPIITVLANGAGLIGGYLTSVASGVSPEIFWRSYQTYTGVGDQVNGLLKTFAFALIIALIGCRQGLTTQGGAQGVGRATTSAVVLSIVGIYIADFLFSVLQRSHALL